MGFNFPNSPTVGTISNGYTWDGEKWVSGTNYGAIYMSDTPPAAPAGSLWYETDTGLLYARVYDGDSLQWVQVLSGPPDAVLFNTVQSLTAAQQTQARKNVYAAPLDALAYSGMQTNGSAEVSQIYGGTGTNANSATVCDGWIQAWNGTMVLIGTAGPLPNAVPGFSGLLYMQVTTAQTSLGAGDYAVVLHRIEGCRLQRLAWGTPSAQPITIGFWTTHNRAGLYTGSIRNPAGTRSYVFTYTQTVANVSQYNVITIPGCVDGVWPVDNTLGMVITFTIASGTGNTASSINTWLTSSYLAGPGQINGIAATSDVFRITGLIVVPGIEAPSAARSPLIMRSLDQELLTCQRYFRKSYNTTVNPGTVTGEGQSNIYHDGLTVSGHTGYGTVYFSPMRIIPSITLYSPATGVSGRVRDYNNSVDVAIGGSAGANNISTNTFTWYAASATASAVLYMSMQYIADARLT